jgi:PEP-CTERM putative exosortase interaction domain
MNNLYHRVAVASVCTALGFALGANKEAKAATFSSDYYLYPFSTLTFQAIDGGSYGSFDGQGDTVTNVSYHNNGESIQPHSWHDAIERTDSREVAALLESPFSSMTRYLTGYSENAKITSITNAVLQIYVSYWEPYNDSAVMGVFGYVGNGIAEASDFETGVFLNSREIREYGTWYDFNVTPFVQQIVSSNNEFAGFALRSLNQNKIVLPISEGVHYYSPKLIVSGKIEGGVEPEPVPEPTTIFGSALALGVGGWLKRKKSSQKNKTTPQG